MKMKTTGLGKGLNAIFEIEQQANPEADESPVGVAEVALSKIEANPNQPRTLFDEDSLKELSDSIARLGVIQPITLRQTGDDKFMIISGERRFRASRMAGRETIPAYVRQADDDQVLEMALVENIQREDLNAMEISIAMQRLIDEYSLTQETLAERVGKKRSTVANYIRLLKLPAEVQMAIRGEMLSMGHARALAGLNDVQLQLSLLDRILRNGMSVRQTEEAVATIENPKPKQEKAEPQVYPEPFRALVERLERVAGNNIRIKRNNKGRGQIVIRFANDRQAEQLIESLKNL